METKELLIARFNYLVMYHNELRKSKKVYFIGLFLAIYGFILFLWMINNETKDLIYNVLITIFAFLATSFFSKLNLIEQMKQDVEKELNELFIELSKMDADNFIQENLNFMKANNIISI